MFIPWCSCQPHLFLASCHPLTPHPPTPIRSSSKHGWSSVLLATGHSDNSTHTTLPSRPRLYFSCYDVLLLSLPTLSSVISFSWWPLFFYYENNLKIPFLIYLLIGLLLLLRFSTITPTVTFFKPAFLFPIIWFSCPFLVLSLIPLARDIFSYP